MFSINGFIGLSAGFVRLVKVQDLTPTKNIQPAKNETLNTGEVTIKLRKRHVKLCLINSSKHQQRLKKKTMLPCPG